MIPISGIESDLSMAHQPKKLRMTRQRKVILEALRAHRSHPTAGEVYQDVRNQLPKLSLATVYRNLAKLSEQDLIRRIDSADGVSRYDAVTREHYHARCVRCGKLADVDLAPPTQLEEKARQDSGYRIVGHRLEFVGLCPHCQSELPTTTD